MSLVLSRPARPGHDWNVVRCEGGGTELTAVVLGGNAIATTAVPQ